MDKFLELSEKVSNFVRERDWGKFHNPKDVAISISIEAAELLENFQWRNDKEVDKMLEREDYLNRITEEMADVMIYLIVLSNKLGVNLIDIALKKIKKNEEKYPVSKFKGNAFP
ncbi:MAG: nucleotide pyrophosphohydrolase [Thermoplasmata archaeon]|nr:nucleotide pyrophosphohydrolase [Candidatus Bipolaricaulota bacterium]RLF45573.1 MAG: nucleotide pyrophosphohydrolase [Thermoplasmata archaeon]RLF63326.1 MAG: nucleotide pyrophosphohydrolase [Thermoplasmata archaeon]